LAKRVEETMTMMTFDLAEVRGFAADLDLGMDQCDNGDGTGCATLDAALRSCADLCREFCDQVRRWGDAVFSGRVAFDPEVERVLKEEGQRLYARALEISNDGRMAGSSPESVEGNQSLQAALWDLDRLLKGWVTPQRAVGPAARQWLIPGSAATEEGRQRVASLPPLPENWQPSDPRLQAMYLKARTAPSDCG
jgi:hypothetical protein